MLKVKKISLLMLLTVLLSVSIPSVTLATSVEELKKEEAKMAQEGDSINTEIDAVVQTVNKKYQELAKIEQDISKFQKEIEQTEKDIVVTQESISKRTEIVAGRMQDMQVRGASQNTLEALIGSTSFNDFINRAFAVSVLQNAENTKIEALYDDKVRLDQLEEKLSSDQAGLKGKQVTAQSEKKALDTQVTNLKGKLATNADVLKNLTTQRVNQENEERAREIARQEEKKRQENESILTDTSTNGSGESSTGNGSGGGAIVPPPTTVTPPPGPPSTGGMAGQATAYIATGNNTATGTVPTPGRTIAVDPSLIPLGSRVQIIVPSAPQYSGIYIAEDTGGAVKGAIVDIFVGGETEANNFGRRGITITVL